MCKGLEESQSMVCNGMSGGQIDMSKHRATSLTTHIYLQLLVLGFFLYVIEI